MHASMVALEYIQPILQPGSIIIIDDYYAYKGDENLGPCGAFNRFLNKYTTIKARSFADYGYWGKAFIITKVKL